MKDASLTIAQLAPLVRSGRASPVELTKDMLARIERLQPVLNAFITVTPELAMSQARAAEKEIARGEYRGALHGIPLCLKDLFHVRGVPTTAGSKVLREHVPQQNAAVVERLFEAGAVLLGKTNLHEFAYGATNVNPHYGPVRNPWDVERISGGSSGGSAAAVACGLGLASLGTDTGGSIRIPAAACGIVGLKPTFGRVPLHGVIPLAPTLDHAGPLCRSVADAAILLEVIAGEDWRDPDSRGPRGERFSRLLRRGIRGLRVGVPRQYFFDRVQPEVRRCVLEAVAELEQAGASVREVRIEAVEQTGALASTLTVGEALAFHWQWLKERPEDYGDDLRERMLAQGEQKTRDYALAQRARRLYRESFMRVLQSVEVLAAPSLPIVAPRIEETEVRVGRRDENVREALLRLTRPGNLAGLPAVSVPCGFTPEGLPVGLQLIGRPWDEANLLRAARAYEERTAWHTAFPDPEAKQPRPARSS